jgi:dienelactone hydrolase
LPPWAQLPRARSHTIRTMVQSPVREHLANSVGFCNGGTLSSLAHVKTEQKGNAQ